MPESPPRARAVPALDELVERVRERVPRALGRAISLLESGGAPAAELVRRLHPDTGRARVVGVTGPPGAGKSTLVDRLAGALRARGESVGILCVDPTSPFSGGALLGDRIRMQGLATDPGVFIRSMATRGALGGLARATRDAVDLLDGAGFDWVLVETVGVGQDEVDVVASVDTVLVVVVPGLGDDIQAIKAGIMEIADVFVLNKADREGADRTHRDVANVLALAEHGDWLPPIVRTVASRSEGIDELVAAVESHRVHLAEGGRLAERRRRQLRLRVESILKERILAAARDEAGLDSEVDRGFAARVDPYRVADTLFREIVRAAGRGAAPGAAAQDGPRIDHVGVAVRSIAEARGFWEALGLSVEAIEEVPQERVRVAMLPLGPAGGARIELLEATSADSPIASFLEKRGPGIHHLCLASDDVEADDARLRAAGFELLRPAPTAGAGGSRVQFVHPRSAGGVLVELAQPAAGGEGER